MLLSDLVMSLWRNVPRWTREINDDELLLNPFILCLNPSLACYTADKYPGNQQ